MIILDTNVLSEPLRASPSASVVGWLDAQSVETLFLTTVTLAEIRFGIASLPEGRRRSTLAARFDEDLLPLFAGRVLPFDVAVADVSADLRASARAAGRPVGLADAQIAAIASTLGFAVATRDTAPFAAMGVPVIDPFA